MSLNYHSQLGLLDKGGVIKGLVVCWNIRIPLQADDALDSLNDHFEVEGDSRPMGNILLYRPRIDSLNIKNAALLKKNM